MTDQINLVVDYEDEADWLQDSVIVDNTRSMYNPPSSHIRITGYAPADSDVVVKRGVNFWVDENSIWAQ